MKRNGKTVALLITTIVALGCQKVERHTNNISEGQVKTVRLHFENFTKSKSGATWMAWPDAVNEALLGLPGIHEVALELKHDQFVVKYDATQLMESEILNACEKSGFPATVATDIRRTESENELLSNEVYTAPDFYLEALKSAKRDDKPLVLDFMATWCAPCKRISDETFVDKTVAQLLEKCILLKIDTDEYPAIARHFGVSALPDIRFLNSDGVQVKQLTGFQGAEVFANELRELLGKDQ